MSDHNRYHVHAETQREIRALREAFRELRGDLEEMFNRISALEGQAAQLHELTGGGQ